MLPAAEATDLALQLREAIDVGDVAAVLQLAAALDSGSDTAALYREKIVDLANAFDFDGLSRLANELAGDTAT